MQWISDQMVGTQPMHVYHCELCDKYAAERPAAINGAKTDSPRSLVTGL